MVAEKVEKMTLEDRKKIVEELSKQISTVTKTVLEVSGLATDVKISGETVSFRIDGKDYYVFPRINRNRKGHWESKYIGSPGCCISMSDSPYDDYWVDDEEE